jgi:hypothetical protein
MNNWGNMSGHERRKWEKRTKKARATIGFSSSDPDHVQFNPDSSPHRSQHDLPVSEMHGFTGETPYIPQSSSEYPYDASRGLNLDPYSPLDIPPGNPHDIRRDDYSLSSKHSPYNIDYNDPPPRSRLPIQRQHRSSRLDDQADYSDSEPPTPKQAFSGLRPTSGDNDNSSNTSTVRRKVVPLDTDVSSAPPQVPDKDDHYKDGRWLRPSASTDNVPIPRKMDLPNSQTDPDRIRENNISNLAAALNHPEHRDIDMLGSLSTMTHDNNGKLNRKWVYLTAGQTWYHQMEMEGYPGALIFRLSNKALEYHDDNPGGQSVETTDMGWVFGSYLQAASPE